MASPHIVVFALFSDPATPLTGATPTFLTYKDETGSNLSQPSITEVGGGFYKFTPAFTTNHTIMYIIDGGASASPRLVDDFLRPEDYNEDLISAIQTTLGTPAGASIAADIAGNLTAIGGNLTAINTVNTKLGTPVLASVSLDVAAAKASADASQANTLIARKIATNRWKIIGTQLNFYDDDKVTILYTFDLKDAGGAASVTKIFERSPV